MSNQYLSRISSQRNKTECKGCGGEKEFGEIDNQERCSQIMKTEPTTSNLKLVSL